MKISGALGVVLFLIIFLSACSGGSGSSSDNSNNSDEDTTTSDGDTEDEEETASCTGDSFFAHSPLKSDDIMSIVPLGNFNAGNHILPTDHTYWWLRRSGDSEIPAAQVDLYSPGDITIYKLSVQYFLTSGFEDYDIYFTPQDCSNTEISFRFGHVSSLIQSIQDQITIDEDNCIEYQTGGETIEERKFCIIENVNIEISGGTKIGTAGGTPDQNALDVFVFDYRKEPLSYANMSSYEDPFPDNGAKYYGFVYTQCPIDYYTSDIKTPLEAKYGDWGEVKARSTDPQCGIINWDIKGTAQGNWFPSDPTSFNVEGGEQEDKMISLTYDNVDSTVPYFSVGNSVSTLPMAKYDYTPNSSGTTNREFKDIPADGSIYCFESVNYQLPGSSSDNLDDPFIILMQLVDDDTLKIEKQDASTCSGQSFTSSATTMVR